jgi:ribosomal protein S18 acetylase RimI-like enzyme
MMSSSPGGDFSIREFNFPDDYEAVLHVWENAGPGIHVGRSDTPAEIQKKLQRDPDLFLVAAAGKRIVGSVIGGFDGRRGLVYHLAVDGQYRGNGIGTALMDSLEERLHAKGCLKCYLLVVDDNDEAARYYEQRGWEAMKVTIYGKELA